MQCSCLRYGVKSCCATYLHNNKKRKEKFYFTYISAFGWTSPVIEMECNTFCYWSSLSFLLSFPKMLLILVTNSFYGFSLLLLLLSSFGPLVLAEEDAHFPTASADGINTLCYNHSQIYLQAYFDEEVWALKSK